MLSALPYHPGAERAFRRFSGAFRLRGYPKASKIIFHDLKPTPTFSESAVLMSFPSMSSTPHEQLRAKPRCLVVEDQILIAMSLEAYLEECGWAVAGPLSGNAEAISWLEGNRPDLAIVDFALRDGPCIPLTRVLRERGVPFLIYSGHRPSSALPPELRHVLWVEKPAARASLLRAIASIVPLDSGRTKLSGSVEEFKIPRLGHTAMKVNDLTLGKG